MDIFKTKIDLKDMIDFQPWFIYQEFEFAGTPNATQSLYFSSLIEHGFTYILNQISAKWVNRIASDFPGGEPAIEFIDTKRSRVEQNQPYPLNLYSTPGAVADSNNQLAGTLKNRIYQNEFYQFRQTILIRITRKPPIVDGQLLKMMLTGYMIADLELDQWQR